MICSAIGIWLSLVSATHAQTATVQDVGRCAWMQLPAKARQDYLTAHSQGIHNGTGVLQKHHDRILATVATCAGRRDIPVRWAQVAVTSQAIRSGTANELGAMAGISAEMLDATWAKAPPDAIQCTRANAAKVVGIVNETCPDPKAPLWFLQELKISPASNRAAAEQALFYFNAKAQGIWAESLIARFQEEKR